MHGRLICFTADPHKILLCTLVTFLGTPFAIVSCVQFSNKHIKAAGVFKVFSCDSPQSFDIQATPPLSGSWLVWDYPHNVSFIKAHFFSVLAD